MSKLAEALEKLGVTDEEIIKLTDPDKINAIKALLDGKNEKTENKEEITSSVIDYPMFDGNIKPLVPEGLELVSNVRTGCYNFSELKINYYVSPKQTEKRRWWQSRNFRSEVEGRSYNAAMIDYLLLYPALIPLEMKGKITLFFGSIYLSGDKYDEDRFYNVRYLDCRSENASDGFLRTGEVGSICQSAVFG